MCNHVTEQDTKLYLMAKWPGGLPYSFWSFLEVDIIFMFKCVQTILLLISINCKLYYLYNKDYNVCCKAKVFVAKSGNV